MKPSIALRTCSTDLRSSLWIGNRISFALIGALVLLVGVAFRAEASPVTYSFSVTGTAGPLTGVTENGTFTYDTSSIPAGGNGLVNAAGLLIGLSFTWNGIAYDQTTANTGNLNFLGGTLESAFFGDDCNAIGGCSVFADTNTWFLQALPGAGPGIDDFRYSTPTLADTSGMGTVTTSASPIPEPPTLAVLVLGLLGLGLFKRRTRRGALS